MHGAFTGRRLLLLMSLAYILLLSGCIAFPVPQNEHFETSPPGGLERPWETLKVGPTTRQEVLNRFGEPYRRWYDDRVLVYRWTTSNMEIIVAVTDMVANGAASGFAVTKDHFLLIEFDCQGVVNRFEVKDDGVPADWLKNSWPSADARSPA